MNYKVGDKVRIVSERIGYHWNDQGKMDKWLGKTMTIKCITLCRCYEMVEDKGEYYGNGWNWYPHMIAGLASEPRHEIHITCTDGKTTHAIKKVDGKIVARAKAECCPTDEFDFTVGANLAYDRLMRPEVLVKHETEDAPEQPKREPVKLYCIRNGSPDGHFLAGSVYEENSKRSVIDELGKPCDINDARGMFFCKLVSRPAEVGEWVYVLNKSNSTYKPNKIYKVYYVNNENGVYFALDCRGVIEQKDYLVLDGYKPEPAKAEPEYLNMKVVCVAGSDGFTVGKVYEFKNGVVVDDDGDVRPNNGDQRITSLSDAYLRDWENKFIEFKGE